jgi:hypothetical protein
MAGGTADADRRDHDHELIWFKYREFHCLRYGKPLPPLFKKGPESGGVLIFFRYV